MQVQKLGFCSIIIRCWRKEERQEEREGEKKREKKERERERQREKKEKERKRIERRRIEREKERDLDRQNYIPLFVLLYFLHFSLKLCNFYYASVQNVIALLIMINLYI